MHELSCPPPLGLPRMPPPRGFVGVLSTLLHSPVPRGSVLTSCDLTLSLFPSSERTLVVREPCVGDPLAFVSCSSAYFWAIPLRRQRGILPFYLCILHQVVTPQWFLSYFCCLCRQLRGRKTVSTQILNPKGTSRVEWACHIPEDTVLTGPLHHYILTSWPLDLMTLWPQI